MPKDSEGSTGSSYIVDRKNRKVLIPIDVNKIEDIKELLGTVTEEVAHGKDALEGRQDKKVAEDDSNDEEGLETLGRPANEYVKKKFGEDNNSKIKLTTDGIDLSNADVGEKVGDVVNENYEIATFSSAGIGLIGIGGLSLSLEDNKEELNKISNFIRFPYITVKFLVNKKLTEKDKDVMYTLSPIPENMKRPIVFPFPIPSPEERIFRLPPMVPPKQETPKERREREERIRREEQEFFNELQKPNGIPLHQERPVTIIYTKSDGKKFDGKYKPSPKHDPKTGYPGASKSNIPDIETGQELLEDSYGSSKVKQRYVLYRGRLVEFQPGNDGTWHDYTVEGNEVPIDVLRQMRDDGIITNSEYQKLKKGKK